MDESLPSNSGNRPRRRQATIEDIRELYERADAVIEKARESALEPDSQKILRRFTLSEVTELLGIHPSLFYELKDTKDFAVPQGEKSGSKRLFTLEEVHRIQEHLKALPRQRYEIREAAVITVANFKGGVAKTFTAATLAQYFALKGYRTLAIDLDPQGSLTTTFGRNPSRDVDDRETILPYFYGPAMLRNTEDGWTGTLRTAIVPTYWHGLDLVSANLSLYSGDFALGMRRDSEPNFQFHRPVMDAIDTIRADYDVIVLDTPPALSFSTTTAIFASDGLIVPAPAAMLDFESARAFLKMIVEVLSAVKARFHVAKKFEFLKVLITKYQPNVHVQQRLANWQRTIFDEWCVSEPMLLTTVVQSLGPQLQTLYEAQTYKDSRQPVNKERHKISRQALKRAMESANTVNSLIESDVIDLFETRQRARNKAAGKAA